MKSSLKSSFLSFLFSGGGGMVILGARPLEAKNLLKKVFEVLVFHVSFLRENSWNSLLYFVCVI